MRLHNDLKRNVRTRLTFNGQNQSPVWSPDGNWVAFFDFTTLTRFLDACTQFIGAALKAGNAAIVVATASHRDSLLPRLQAYNLNMASAMEEGRYISLDAADMLATLIVNDQP